MSAAVVLSLVGLTLSVVPAQAAPNNPQPPVTEVSSAEAPTTILVTFDHSQADPAAAAQDVVTQAAEAVPGVEIADVRPITTTTAEVTLAAGVDSANADRIEAAVANSDGVRAADSGLTFRPTDTNLENDLWNINGATGAYGVNADTAWTTFGITGAGVTVGVVDTGITAHPDLDGNVIAGYDFVSDPARAADGDGVDSDPSDPGDSYTDSDGYTSESSWHGTHVAGIVAAVRNGSGVVGVAPEAHLEPLRVMGRGGGTEADAIAAIRWAAGDTVYATDHTMLPANAHPVDVLNLSLGGPGDCSFALQSAINFAVARNIPVVVAAGNNAVPLSGFSPANCNNVIAVTASTFTGAKAVYSDYGTLAAAATIAAPGGSGYATACDSGNAHETIISTWNSGTSGVGSPTYGCMDGTSMAAPHVTGVVALLKAAHPTWTVAQFTAALRGSATTMPNCSSVECGAGIVNATGAVAINGFISWVKSASVSGTFKVKKTLTARAGSWNPAPVAVSYRWLRNGVLIKGATKAKHKLTRADKGKKVGVEVTLTGPSGYASRIELSKTKKVKG